MGRGRNADTIPTKTTHPTKAHSRNEMAPSVNGSTRRNGSNDGCGDSPSRL